MFLQAVSPGSEMGGGVHAGGLTLSPEPRVSSSAVFLGCALLVLRFWYPSPTNVNSTELVAPIDLQSPLVATVDGNWGLGSENVRPPACTPPPFSL